MTRRSPVKTQHQVQAGFDPAFLCVSNSVARKNRGAELDIEAVHLFYRSG